MLNTFGSRTVGRCWDTDEIPDASEAWSKDIWLLYEPIVELRRLDNVLSGGTSPFIAMPDGGGALSFTLSLILFSIMIVNSGRYNAAMRACDDCRVTNATDGVIRVINQIRQQTKKADR